MKGRTKLTVLLVVRIVMTSSNHRCSAIEMDCGGRPPTAEARDSLAGVAPDTFFLAGVTGIPLADQRLY